MDVCLDTKALTRTFSVPADRTKKATRIRAVNKVDLTIRAGEVVALLGPNGAGKSTLLDMVLGLITPSSGEVRVFGRPPRESIGEGKVSALLQSGGLLRDLTVSETVELIASTYHHRPPIDHALERAGLVALAHRKVGKLSGGEQQRLRFALALLPQPDLLILDEPTAGMDVNARHSFWEQMHHEAHQGRTIVFATHYLQEAETFAQRTVMMMAGQVVLDGSTDWVRAQAGGHRVGAEITPDRAEAALNQLRQRPDVLAATGEPAQDTVRLAVHTTDSDAVARLLLTQLQATRLEIERGSLDQAFAHLTAGAPA